VTTGYVYVAQAQDGLYKIGSTANPSQRRCQLQCSKKQTVVFLIVKELRCRRRAFAMESALHRLFRSKCQGGEWYVLTDDDLNTIEQLPLEEPYEYIEQPEPKALHSKVKAILSASMESALANAVRKEASTKQASISSVIRWALMDRYTPHPTHPAEPAAQEAS